DRVAFFQPDFLILSAVHPGFGDAVEDVQDFHVGVRMHRRDVAGRRSLNPGPDRRRALVVAQDELVDGVGAELDDLGVGETDDLHRLRSASRFRHKIASFSSWVRLARPWTQVTGDGCQGTKGQSLPSTTRSAPTWSRRKRSAASLPVM